MNNDFKISLDTQAVLLLCGQLGRMGGEYQPLTLAQYNVLALALNKLGKRPADLLEVVDSNNGILDEVCALPNENRRVTAATPERILGLLRRGVSLSTALDKWASYGVSVVSRADDLYPKRLRDHLGVKAPMLLYYAGCEDLLPGGGMAFVGSRDINEDSAEALKKVVGQCVNAGMNIVSGGARGADQTAMHEAFSLGGKVIGALPCDLLKFCLDPINRDALADGRALLFSAFDPEVRPFSYGQAAMDRNKYIYGMADASFVAQSGIGKKCGTWAGAEEELKNEKANPVFVYMAEIPSEGCVDLAKKGAIPWDMGKGVAENLAVVSSKTKSAKYECVDLFDFSAAEPEPIPYGNKVVQVSEGEEKIKNDYILPYEVFVNHLKDLLQVSRKESEVKKKLISKLDLLPSQFKHWLEKAELDGVVVRKEFLNGKKKCVMLQSVS